MKALGPDRPRVLIAYGLLIVEEAALLGLPALIGLTVDRLLSGDAGGLWLLAGGMAAILVSGAFRRFFDTRVFAAAEWRLAGTAASTPAPVGVRAARLRQVSELVQVYERNLPEGLAAAMAAGGSLLASAWYDLRVAAAALFAGLLLLLLNGVYERRWNGSTARSTQ
jgi:hypothetical protein